MEIVLNLKNSTNTYPPKKNAIEPLPNIRFSDFTEKRSATIYKMAADNTRHQQYRDHVAYSNKFSDKVLLLGKHVPVLAGHHER